MEFTIQQLPNGKVTLMTRDGLYLFTFRDLESARQACEAWYERNVVEAGESDSGVSCSVCG